MTLTVFEFSSGSAPGAQSLSHSIHWDPTNSQYTASIGGIYEVIGNGVFVPDSIISKFSWQIFKNSSLVYETDPSQVHLAIAPSGMSGGVTWVGKLADDDAIQVKIKPDVGIKMDISSSYSLKKIS